MQKKTCFTSHPETEREEKSLAFLNLIKKRKSTSRTEISKLTGVNIVSVSNYVNSFLKKGLVIERGQDVSTGGRRPELVELNKDWGFFIGVGICERSINGVLVNLDTETLFSETAEKSPEDNLEKDASKIINKLIASSKNDKEKIKKIGLSIPACISGTDADRAAKEEVIENEGGIPVAIGNDSVCAAFAEYMLNPKIKESKKVLYLHRDVGSGVLIEEDKFCEANEEKEEYSYLRPWSEDSSIVSEAKKMIAHGALTKIADIAGGNVENISLDIVLKAVKEKDELAVDLVRTAGINLGVRAAYLINSFEPDVVIVGGGIEAAGEVFLEPLMKSINRFILEKMKDKTRLIPAMLGHEACAKGSASLAIRETFIES